MATETTETLLTKMTGDASEFIKMLNEVEQKVNKASETVEAGTQKVGAFGSSFSAITDTLQEFADKMGVGKQVSAVLENITTFGERLGPVANQITGTTTGLSILWLAFKNGKAVIEGYHTVLEYLPLVFNTVKAYLGEIKDKFVAIKEFDFSAYLKGALSTSAGYATTAFKYLTGSLATFKAAVIAANAAVMKLAASHLTLGLSGTSASVWTLIKTFGLWGLAIGAVAVAAYGLYKAWDWLTGFNANLAKTNKLIEESEANSVSAAKKYRENTDYRVQQLEGMFTKEARQTYIEDQIGGNDENYNAIKTQLEAAESQLEALEQKGPGYSKFDFLGISNYKKMNQFNAELKEAKENVEELKESLYEAAKGDAGKLTPDIDKLTIDIERAKKAYEDMRKIRHDGKWGKWTDTFGISEASKLKAQEIKEMERQLADMTDRRKQLESKPQMLKDELTDKLKKVTKEYEQAAHTVGKTGDDLLERAARLVGVDEKIIQAFKKEADFKKLREDTVQFENSYKDLVKNMEQEADLAGLEGVELAIEKIRIQAQKLGRELPAGLIDKLLGADARKKEKLQAIEFRKKSEGIIDKFSSPMGKLQTEMYELVKMNQEGLFDTAPTQYLKALEDIEKRMKAVKKATDGASRAGERFNAVSLTSAEAITKMEEQRDMLTGNKYALSQDVMTQMNGRLPGQEQESVTVLKSIRDLLRQERMNQGLPVNPTDFNGL